MQNDSFPSNIDEYIRGFDSPVREKLEIMRRIISESAPDAVEAISYRMPTFRLYGNLVHFAAFKSHIGFYPAPTGIEAFGSELSQYGNAKGSVRFPHDRPLPEDLIRRIVRFRVEENTANHEAKKAGKRNAEDRG
jgi:uncharacterized protein YdhG (YjbR/CyaY superfamily)